jgi:glycosyltransferase involved in cell wall biosynthesis
MYHLVKYLGYRIKILHITPSYYPATFWGGPIFSVYALNNALAGMPDASLKILTTDAAGPQVRNRLQKASLEGLYSNQELIMSPRVMGSSVSPELLWKLPSLVCWADVVHLTATYSFPTIPTLAICLAFNKPLVWSPRGAILDAHVWKGSRRRQLKHVWERLCNILIRRGKVVTHTTSECERVITQKRLLRATAMVVPNGVDVPDVLPERDWLPNGQMRLMYLGRLSPKKGIENLLQAIVGIDQSTVSLTIYGAGDAAYTTSLNELAEHLGLLGKSVFFAGNVDGEAKSLAFQTSDVCVVPSYTENFCMVVAEALAHGIPVIASHGTPWADVEKNRCGLWVDNSPESLAHAITHIRSMELPEMGARGRDWMMSDFSWDSVAKKMMGVYQSLIDSERHATDR